MTPPAGTIQKLPSSLGVTGGGDITPSTAVFRDTPAKYAMMSPMEGSSSVTRRESMAADIEETPHNHSRKVSLATKTRLFSDFNLN